ncbi:adenosine deaminase AGSA-like [Babylonia areolata]|uniref:adenosine deaminase AGSA-like n=1 Tax=Babylonia areolata TaxID=304850 RepID=UPI003FD367AF
MVMRAARASGFLALASLLCGVVLSMPEDYARRRDSLINQDLARRVGGLGDNTTLTCWEQAVDKMLLEEKRKVVADAMHGGAEMPMNFLTSRPAMESTESFRIIRKMPKGAILHVHKTAMVSLDWVIKNVTYRPHLYMCVDSQLQVHFKFSDHQPDSSDCKWDLVSNFRAQHGNASEFDKTLYQNLSLVTPDPATAYPDINAVWDAFEGYFGKVRGLLYYRPVWRDYLLRAMQEMLEDKVQYVEIRGSLPELYELDGYVHESEWSIENTFRPAFAIIQQAHPSFIGAKLIITAFRGIDKDAMQNKVESAARVYRKYPDLVLGFDIVGQEDRFRPLSDFVDVFLQPEDLPYYFHAGETAWLETATDYNLVDALLLKSRRIGHGYALAKHPALMDRVRRRHVAVEVNPISNQVLKLVEDLRNHPAASFLASNLPVVISSDDPAVWDALPLTHDFYLTFMALLGQDTGLAALKQLALNSIKFSSLNGEELAVALRKWQKEWDAFIMDTAGTSHGCS